MATHKNKGNMPEFYGKGMIGEIYGMSIYTSRMFMRNCPRFFPNRLWYWLANIFTETINMNDEDWKRFDKGDEKVLEEYYGHKEK